MSGGVLVLSPSDFDETPSRRTPRACLPAADLLDVEDVAAFYGVTAAAIRKRIREGKLGTWLRSGRRYAIRKSSFLRWLDAQERAAEAAG